MGTKVSDDLISTVRSVVGFDYSDMEIIRALHMAKHDPTAAINIIFDTPNFSKSDVSTPSPSGSNGGKIVENSIKSCRFRDGESVGVNHRAVEDESLNGGEESVSGDEWWFVGCSELAGFSTCKGRQLKSGDELVFTFPHNRTTDSGITPGKRFRRGRQALRASSEIVRFSTKDSGEVLFCFPELSDLILTFLIVMLRFHVYEIESSANYDELLWQIGRIPNEWALCLLPLVRDKKIKIQGRCKSAPGVLGITDTILLSVRYSQKL